MKPDDFDNKNMFSLNYMPQKNIDYLINKYQDVCFRKNLDCQIIYNPIDISKAGFIIPSLNLGFVSFMPYENEFFKDKTVANDKDIININLSLDKAYNQLKSALQIHDQWEQIYINGINYNSLNRLKDSLVRKIFDNNIERSVKKQGTCINRFFGSVSANGSCDFLSDIIKNYKTRYFIKGRPGSGKSTLLKNIASAALKSGFDVCSYHCAFDPESLDMVCIKDLNVCVFDSTFPHEYFPDRDSDNLIDIYNIALSKDFDLKNKHALDNIKKEYSLKINAAVESIKTANSHLQKFKDRYSKTFNNKKFKYIDLKFSKTIS